jgi:DNA gyrase subunit B
MSTSTPDFCWPEFIRMSPGTYLVLELLNNAQDEAHAGVCQNVAIDLQADGGCRVRDDGMGIPVEVVTSEGKRYLEAVFTRGRNSTLHCPCGLVKVNALSRRLVVEVCRDGQRWRQDSVRGQPTAPIQVIGQARRTGTSITCWPDPDIFQGDGSFSFNHLRDRVREVACLQPALTLQVRDRRARPARVCSFGPRLGLVDLLQYLSSCEMPVHPSIVYGKAEAPECRCEVAFRWVHALTDRLVGFVNEGRTDEGTHREALHAGLRGGLSSRLGMLTAPNGRRIPPGKACRVGLLAVAAVWLQGPHYNSATKERILDLEIIRPVSRLVRDTLETFLRDHPDEADAILAHLRNPRPADPKSGLLL